MTQLREEAPLTVPRLERYRVAAHCLLHRANLNAWNAALGQSPPRREAAEGAMLFDLEALQWLRIQRDETPLGTPARRRIGALLRFCWHGYALAEAGLLIGVLRNRQLHDQLSVGATQLTVAEAFVQQSTSDSAGRRLELEAAYLDWLDMRLRPILAEVARIRDLAARRAGWDSAFEADADCAGTDLRSVLAACARLLSWTQGAIEPARVAIGQTLQIPPPEIVRGDLGRYFWANNVTARARYGRALGNLIGQSSRVSVQVVHRSSNYIRPRCYPIAVPHDIRILLSDVSGRPSLKNELHELTHAAHLSRIRQDAPFEDRVFVDEGLAESYAFLFDGLVGDERWLNGQLFDHSGWSTIDACERLLTLRRYCAIAHHAASLCGSESQYVRDMRKAMGGPWPSSLREEDLAQADYAVQYVRGWLAAARMEMQLTSDYGAAWFDCPEALSRIARAWRAGGAASTTFCMLAEHPLDELAVGRRIAAVGQGMSRQQNCPRPTRAETSGVRT